MKIFAPLLAIATLSLPCPAEDWPAWRGPDGTGAAPDSGPVLKSGLEPAWSYELPGRGCSTPISTHGKIFVTAPIDGEDGVIALDLDGKELWKKTVGTGVPGRGQRVGSSCNSSPVTDGQRVFAYFKSGNLAAFTLEGEKLWQINVFEKYGPDKLWWDVGTSPVIAGGNLVLAVMQTEGDSFLVSLDRKTGDEVWKTEREFETGRESGDSYTTPLVEEIDGVETIVCWGADHLTGHDASDGRLLWTCGGFNPDRKGMWRVIASAVATDGVAVVPYARGDALAGVKLGGAGDITDEAFLWKKDGVGTDAATPVARDGKVYLLKDRDRGRGKITCLDAKTGDVAWEAELPRAPQTYYASPLLAGDLLYCPREDGTVFCAKLGDKGIDQLTQLELRENLIASPSLVDGRLLLRGGKHLVCFGE